MNDFKHLDYDILPLMELPPEERAMHILADRFFEHERLVPILDYVEFLHGTPRQTRAKDLIVSGASGSGKSTIARFLQRKYPPQPPSADRPQGLSVIAIDMSGAKEAKTLYNRVLERCGVPEVGLYSGSDRERMVLKVCRQAGLKLLVVDEIQDVLKSTERQQSIALDTIKFLMNELQLSILAMGTSAAPTAMSVDEHLRARFQHMELPTWKDDKYLKSLLQAMERKLPLKKPSILTARPAIEMLLKVSDGVLNGIIEAVTWAAAAAVESGAEQTTPDVIRYVRLRPPALVLRRQEAADPKKKMAE